MPKSPLPLPLLTPAMQAILAILHHQVSRHIFVMSCIRMLNNVRWYLDQEIWCLATTEIIAEAWTLTSTEKTTFTRNQNILFGCIHNCTCYVDWCSDNAAQWYLKCEELPRTEHTWGCYEVCAVEKECITLNCLRWHPTSSVTLPVRGYLENCQFCFISIAEPIQPFDY